MTGQPDAGGHLDLDALAHLDEGLVEGPRASAMTSHLESCTVCQARRADLRRTREALGGLPPEPVPDDVVARLDTAIANASASPTTVVPLSSGRRRWAGPTFPGLAAAFVTLALIGAVVVGVLASNHGTTPPPQSGAALPRPATGAGVNPHYPVRATGRDYTKRNIPQLVTQLVTDTSAAAAGRTATGTAVTHQLDRLYGSRLALNDCVAALSAGEAPQTPLAVDFARFTGRPAVVVVLPGLTSTNVDAWVVGPDCNRRDEHLLYYVSLPRPG